MQTRKVLGVSMAVVFAIALTPAAFAGIAFPDYYFLEDAEVRIKDHPKAKDMGLKLEAYTTGNVPTVAGDLLGYGVLTDQWLIVTTSHAGVWDSELQSATNDPTWHNHYVLLQGDSECPGALIDNTLKVSVADLTWESPGNDPKIDDTEIKITNIPTGNPPAGTWRTATSLDGNPGAAVAVNTGNISDTFVSFQLSAGPSSQICVQVIDAITASD